MQDEITSWANKQKKKKKFFDALYYLFTDFFYLLTELVLGQRFNEAAIEWMELFIDD